MNKYWKLFLCFLKEYGYYTTFRRIIRQDSDKKHKIIKNGFIFERECGLFDLYSQKETHIKEIIYKRTYPKKFLTPKNYILANVTFSLNVGETIVEFENYLIKKGNKGILTKKNMLDNFLIIHSIYDEFYARLKASNISRKRYTEDETYLENCIFTDLFDTMIYRYGVLDDLNWKYYRTLWAEYSKNCFMELIKNI